MSKNHGIKVQHKNSNKAAYENTIDFEQLQNERSYKAPKRKVELVPKTRNQEKYILALDNPDVDIVISHGPAGTGKTHLAVLAAIKALRENNIDRIILTRPAVGVDDEKHGFLPGDINQKMEPWTKPLFDVIREYYSVREITRMVEEQIIEIVPLAFCRGRNFKNSYVILDEAQNVTPSSMKTFLTRIGEGSKMIVCGDIEQADKRTSDNGLLDLLEKCKKKNIPGMELCSFENKDIQRHSIISYILDVYK